MSSKLLPVSQQSLPSTPATPPPFAECRRDRGVFRNAATLLATPRRLRTNLLLSTRCADDSVSEYPLFASLRHRGPGSSHNRALHSLHGLPGWFWQLVQSPGSADGAPASQS